MSEIASEIMARFDIPAGGAEPAGCLIGGAVVRQAQEPHAETLASPPPSGDNG